MWMDEWYFNIFLLIKVSIKFPKQCSFYYSSTRVKFDVILYGSLLIHLGYIFSRLLIIQDYLRCVGCFLFLYEANYCPFKTSAYCPFKIYEELLWNFGVDYFDSVDCFHRMVIFRILILLIHSKSYLFSPFSPGSLFWKHVGFCPWPVSVSNERWSWNFVFQFIHMVH